MPDQNGKQVAIVVGGSGGTGRIVAQQLASDGMDVVVHYNRNREKALNVVEQIEKKQGRALAISADITKLEQAEELVARTVQHFKRVDVLVICSGSHRITEEMRKLPRKERFVWWNHIVGLNLTGPTFVAYAVCPQMIKQNYGRIIVMSSTAKNGIGQALDYEDILHRCSYSSAKEGLVGLTNTLANYLAIHNVTVNCLVPGPIHEPGAQVSAAWQKKLSIIPMKRAASPKDVAEAVSFFASENASYITGNTVYVSGGFLAMGFNPEIVDWAAYGNDNKEM